MPGTHRKKVPGRHRKPSTVSITWRTTGGMMVGAAVLGTAAATAQASVLPFDSAPAHVAASGRGSGENARTTSSKDGDKDEDKGGSGDKGDGAKKDEPESGDPKESSDESRPTAEEAIKLARSQVGTGEDDAGGSKFNKWYASTSRAEETVARDGGSIEDYDDAAWCDMFIAWIGDQLGFSDQMGHDAWTVAHAEWFQEQGRWGTEPKPGAIVFYAWDGGKSNDDIRHVGMVTKKVDDDTIEAVEGNTSDAVRVKERSTDDVVGYGYPEYKS